MHFSCGLLVLFIPVVVRTTDLSQQARARAITSVVQQIWTSGFLNDDLLLQQLANVETKDDTDPKTFQRRFNGGIWHVNKTNFAATQSDTLFLRQKRREILQALKIDWTKVTWLDLNKPLYSGLAAALCLMIQNSHQAEIGSNVEKMPRSEALFPSDTCQVTKELDLLFIVDESDSISLNNFNFIKEAIKRVVNGFSIGDAKIAVITFSDTAKVAFHFNQYGTKAKINNAVDALQHTVGRTNTAGALKLAATDVFSTSHGARPNAAKAVILFTDGKSDDFFYTQQSADNLKANGIHIFPVAVGNIIDFNELITVASNPIIFHLNDSSRLIDSLKKQMLQKTCQAIKFINSTYSCFLKCPTIGVWIPDSGITFKINTTCGQVKIYGTFTKIIPGPNVHEIINTVSLREMLIFYVKRPNKGQPLYLTFVRSGTGTSPCKITINPVRGKLNETTVTAIPTMCSPIQSINWAFPNPCTKDQLLNHQFIFRYPHDNAKFILCDYRGHPYIVSCPTDEIYSDSCKSCVHVTSASKSCGQVYTKKPNPCTIENALLNKTTFPYLGDNHLQLHCNNWGQPFVK